MAVINIELIQDNVIDNVNVFAIHSPLVFIIEVEHDGNPPSEVSVKINDIDDDELGEFSAVPLEDITLTRRSYMFMCSGILTGYMNDYADLLIANDSLTHDVDMQKYFKVIFEAETETVETEFYGVTAAQQYGETEAIISIVENEDDRYYAAEGMPVYCYLWNNDESNEISVGTPIAGENALEYNDDVFVDYDGKWFKIE